MIAYQADRQVCLRDHCTWLSGGNFSGIHLSGKDTLPNDERHKPFFFFTWLGFKACGTGELDMFYGDQ